MKDSKPFLHHILEEIEYLLSRTGHLSFSDFAKDDTLKRAFVRSLEIIGEAVKNLPDPFKSQYPDIPWRQISGMRDKLIHFYFGVNYQLVWEAIQGELPDCVVKFKRFLRIVMRVAQCENADWETAIWS